MRKLYFLFSNLLIATACFAQPYDGFLSLDGTDDYAENLSTPIPDNTDFTIEFLFKPCNLSGRLIDARGSTAGSGIEITCSASNLMVSMEDNSTNTSGFVQVFETFNADTWYHVAVTHREIDSVNTVYLDGIKMEEFKAPFEPRQKMVVGKVDHTESSFFGGYMDELRISDVERYTADFTVPASEFSVDANTSALFHFNEAAGEMTTFADETGAHDLTAYRGAHTNGAIFISADQTIDKGDNVQLSAGGGTEYAWTPKESLDDSTLATPLATPEITTKYYVTVSDSNNCEHLDSVTITVNQPLGFFKSSNSLRNTVFPNPTLDQVQYQYRVENNGTVSIALYNAVGEKIRTVREGEESAGTYSVTIDIPDKGLYYLVFDSEGHSETQLIVRN